MSNAPNVSTSFNVYGRSITGERSLSPVSHPDHYTTVYARGLLGKPGICELEFPVKTGAESARIAFEIPVETLELCLKAIKGATPCSS